MPLVIGFRNAAPTPSTANADAPMRRCADRRSMDWTLAGHPQGEQGERVTIDRRSLEEVDEPTLGIR
jgi:hypothetical protein